MSQTDLYLMPGRQDFFKKLRLRQHVFAYSFLAVFVFYPLLQGIYISFLEYQLPKNPTIGGPIAFIRAFAGNLHHARDGTFSVILLLLSVGTLAALILKRVSWKAIALGLVAAMVINLVPLGNVLTLTLQQINYHLEDDRTVENGMLSGMIAMMEDLYGQDAEIIQTPVNGRETRIVVKRSIWVGPAVYRSILPNPEYLEFVKRNAWYVALLFSPFLGFLALELLKRQRRRERGLERGLRT